MKTLKSLLKIAIIPILVGSLNGKINAQESVKTEKPKIKVNFSSDLKSHYVARSGYVLGKGPHKQDFLSIGNKNLDAFFWSDYDFGAKNLGEIDIGLEYSKKFKNFSANLSQNYLYYPRGVDDRTISLSLKQGKKIKKKLILDLFFKNKSISNGLVVKGIISKELKLSKNLAINPDLSFSYVNSFYGDTGLSGIIPGINSTYEFENFSLNGFLNYQFGFINNPKMLPPAKNQFYGGIGISKEF